MKSDDEKIENIEENNEEEKVLIKKKTVPSSHYGWFPDKRPISELMNYGIVIIDKPAGPTSHQVSEYVKNILNVRKAGHTGTLDPKVTGVLPVLINKSTKLASILLGSDKEYIGIMHLHKDIPQYLIYNVTEEFVGKIKQIPPLKSAVKRRERTRTIYYFKILEIDGRDVLFKVGTQGGTYIRKLVHDIGEKLGCGAHMSELRRTKAGGFSEESNMITLQTLEDAKYYYDEEGKENFLRYCIQPVESALKSIKKIWVLDGAVNSICHGAPLAIPGVYKLDDSIVKGERIALLTAKGELIGIGESTMSSKEIIMNNTGICAKIDSVILKEEVYPSVI